MKVAFLLKKKKREKVFENKYPAFFESLPNGI
jgi:hypothetical protein